MTGKQLTVMWLGILLMAMQLYFGGQIKGLLGIVTKKSIPASQQKTPPPNLRIQQPGPL